MVKPRIFSFLSAILFFSMPCAVAGDFRAISAVIDTNAAYYGVSVGNGGIGILPWNRPFSVDQVLMSNVYDENGEGISLSLNAINPFELTFRIDGSDVAPSSMTQSLDLKRAVHSTSMTVDGKAEIKYDIRALRSLPNVGLVEVNVQALNDISIFVEPKFKVPAGYSAPSYKETQYKVDDVFCTVTRCTAKTVKRGVRVSAACALVGPEGNQEHNISLKKGDKIRFWLIGSVVSDSQFIDPCNESDREVVFAFKEGVGNLLAKHEMLWGKLWEGDIIIDGDDDAQDAARLALYHLYSFVREGSRQSISPMGLSAQGYNGHVFWDTEMWMYPPMLFLNSGIARSMMDYRIDRLPAAKRKAYTYGYDGAMFPWESDGAGEESCPVWALTGPFEHHISADIAIAAWNYYRMFGDKDWLRSEGWPMIKSVAEFWTSRVSSNDDGSWSVRNVVCADEYAEGVNDNAFTNAAVKKALEAAVKASKVVGEKADPLWSKISASIRILRSEDGVTLEYEGYDGRTVKQADVNLAAYPLEVITDKGDIRRDLEYYEDRIDPHGPAMSYSMLALQYARLGEGDKAYELFKRSYENNRLPPFGVLAEYAGATNPYFTTGAGGMLQCLINGFGGLELTDKGVKQIESSLPSHWNSLIIKGVGRDSRTFYVKKNN